MTPRSVVLLLSATLLGAGASAEEWQLRFAPEPGVRYRIEMRTEQTGKMASAALPATDMSMTNSIDLSQWLIGVDEAGNSRVAWVYDRMVLEADVGGNRSVIDSAQPVEGATGEMWSGMIGREIVLVLSPAGEVLEIEGLEELLRSALADLPDDQASAGVKELMIQSFSEEQVKHIVQMSFTPYPRQAVGIGDVWSQDIEMNNPAMGKVLVSNDYRATGVEEGAIGPCLAAEVVTEMEFESGGILDQLTEVFRQQGAEVSMQMDLDVQDARGDICVDLGTGLVSRMSQRLEFVMDMTMSIASSELSQDLDMTMTMDVVTELRVAGTEPLEP